MGFSATERTTHLSKHIRFTHSQDKRLEEACAYLGCTLQNFIHEATLERLAKTEAEQRADKEYRARSKKEPAKKREARGLGLRTAQAETTIVDTPAPPAPQVVVNIPATTAAPANDVSMLASFVTKGSALGRDMRLERAREILAASLDGDALDAAKKALDEAVDALATKNGPSLGVPRTGGVLDFFK